MIQADSVHSTPPTNTSSELSHVHTRAEFFADLEQPLPELTCMAIIVKTLVQEPPRIPDGITEADLVHTAIQHFDVMMLDVFGNYRARLKETGEA